MVSLSLPLSTISSIIDDPTRIGSSEVMSSLGISPETAAQILTGYNHGFRTLFIMNASLSALATVISILLIKHKSLSGVDEDRLKQGAQEQDKMESLKATVKGPDPELGEIELVARKHEE